jgi:hypothetical protein
VNVPVSLGAVTVIVATPTGFTAAVPIDPSPALKVIVPSGAPTGIGATVPVKVMDWPAPPGFGETTSVVTVGVSGLITCETAVEVEAANAVFPE